MFETLAARNGLQNSGENLRASHHVTVKFLPATAAGAKQSPTRFPMATGRHAKLKC
jgi:hypothetical protein